MKGSRSNPNRVSSPMEVAEVEALKLKTIMVIIIRVVM